LTFNEKAQKVENIEIEKQKIGIEITKPKKTTI
jgi:hypothetical protein